MIVLIFIFINIFDTILSSCINYSSTNVNKCILCDTSSYNDEFLYNNEFDECFSKSITTDYIRTIYIESIEFPAKKNYMLEKGSFDNPYLNLGEALIMENLKVLKYFDINIKIKLFFKLFKGNNYIENNEKNIHLFRRSNIEILITPHFCDDIFKENCINSNDKINIIWNTNRYYFFISNRMIINSFIFKGGIDFLNNNEQKLQLDKDYFLKMSKGLFNLESIKENSIEILPRIEFNNCEFVNLSNYNDLKSYYSFIMLDNFSAEVILNKTKFKNNYFFFGILYKKNFLDPIYTKIIISSNTFQSNIQIIDSIIQNYYDYEILIVSTSHYYLTYSLFSLYDFSGIFSFKNNILEGNFIKNGYFFNFYYSMQLEYQIDFIFNYFISNKFNSLISFTGFYSCYLDSSLSFLYNVLIDNIFDNFQVLKYLPIFILIGDFINFKMPKDTFIHSQFTNITIKDSIFHKLFSEKDEFYAVLMDYSHQTEQSAFLLSSSTKKVYYSNDSFFFTNNSFIYSNILLIKCSTFCYSIHITKSIFKDLNLTFIKSLIYFSPEYLFNISDVLFFNVISKFSLIYTQSFLKLTIENFILIKLQMYSNNMITFMYRTVSDNVYNTIIKNMCFINSSIETKRDSIDRCSFFWLHTFAQGMGSNINLTNGYFENLKISLNKLKSNILQLETIFNYQKNVFFLNISDCIASNHDSKGNGEWRILNVVLFSMNTIYKILDCEDADIAKILIENCFFFFGYTEDRHSIYFITTSNIQIVNLTIIGAGSVGTFLFFQIKSLANALLLNVNMKNLKYSTFRFITFGTLNKLIIWSSVANYNKSNFGIINSTFINCYNNSAIILLPNTELLVKNSIFKELEGIEGAVIKLESNSQLFIINSLIFNCLSTKNGGSFYLENSFIFIDNLFINYTRSYIDGGFASLLNSIIVITNSKVIQSSSKIKGGLIILDNSEGNITNCIFFNSIGEELGGHIYTKEGKLIIEKTEFLQGTSKMFGASFYIENTYLTLINSIIMDCSTETGIFFISGMNHLKNSFSKVLIKNNLVSSSSIFFNKDMDLEFEDCEFNENIADKGYIFEFSGFSLIIIINFKNINFLMNEAYSGFIKTQYSISSLDNASISLNLFKNSLFNLIDTKLFLNQILSNANNKEIFKPYYFELSTSSLDIKNSSFDLNYSLGFFFSMNSITILLSNVNIIAAKNKFGGAIYLFYSNFNGSNLFFFNNNAEEGGVISSDYSNVNISNSIFSSNYANKIASDIKSMRGDLILESCKFLNISKKSIFLFKSNLLFIFSDFKGCKTYSRTNCQALESLDCYSIKINFTNFTNFLNNSVLLFENSLSSIIIINIFNCNFFNGNSDLGSFIFIKGNSKVKINNSTFSNGYAEKGGAIYYECSNLKNCSFILNNSFFYDNFAVISGGCLQSYSYSLINENNYFFNNSAKTGNNLNFFPSKLIVLLSENINKLIDYSKSISQENQLMKNTIKNIPNQIKLIEENLELIPGYKYYFSIIVVDNFLTIQRSENNNKVLFSFSKKSNILNASFINNLLILVNGNGLLKDLVLSSSLNQSYHCILSHTSLTRISTFALDFTLKAKICPIGDSFQDGICQTCKLGKFSFDLIPNENSCKDCPKNSYCPGGNIIIPDVGYWRKDNNTFTVVKCHSEKACPLQNINMSIFICQTGFHGELCFLCDDRYGKSDNECVYCSDNKALFFALLIFGLIIIIGYCYFQEWIIEKKEKTDHISLLLTKILQNHLSSFVIISSLKMDWSTLTESILIYVNNFGSTSPGSIYKFDCIITGEDKDVIWKTQIIIGFSPLILVFIMLVLGIIKLFFKNLISLNKLSNEIYKYFHPSNLINESIKHITVIYFNCFAQILVQSLKIYSCKKIDDTDILYLSNFPYIVCHESLHLTLITISSFFICFWAIIVPIFLFFLIRNSNHLILSSDLVNIKEKRIFIISFVTRGYKTKFYYWELIILLRKTLILILITWAEDLDMASLGGLTILFYFLFLIVNERSHPFTNIRINNLENFSLITIISTIAFAMLSNFDDLSSAIRFIFYISILIINIVFFIFWIRNYSKKLIERLRTSKLENSKKSKFNGRIKTMEHSENIMQIKINNYNIPTKKKK